jgi:hypothetical protein
VRNLGPLTADVALALAYMRHLAAEVTAGRLAAATLEDFRPVVRRFYEWALSNGLVDAEVAAAWRRQTAPPRIRARRMTRERNEGR